MHNKVTGYNSVLYPDCRCNKNKRQMESMGAGVGGCLWV